MKRTLGRAFALGGSLLLVGGLLVAAATSSHAADPLLSLNKPTTTSSNESGALNGPKAVDGNAATRWAIAGEATRSGSASTSATPPRSARSS